MTNTARFLEIAGAFEEAEDLLREALDRRRQSLGDSHLMIIRSMTELGSYLRDHGDLDEAQSIGSQALVLAEENLGHDQSDRGDAAFEMGLTLIRLQRFEEAETHLLEAVEVYEVSENRRFNLQDAVEELITLYRSWFEHDGDRRHLDQVNRWQQHTAVAGV